MRTQRCGSVLLQPLAHPHLEQRPGCRKSPLVAGRGALGRGADKAAEMISHARLACRLLALLERPIGELDEEGDGVKRLGRGSTDIAVGVLGVGKVWRRLAGLKACWRDGTRAREVRARSRSV